MKYFTYTVDGNYSEFTRTFPDQHHHQITAFEAYVINDENPIAGEVTGDRLQQLYVNESGTSRSVTVKAKNQRISIFYMYVMKNAIKSYESYSDLDITYFEKGSNHKVDINEVSIEYVLPSEIGSDKIHGFMHDRHAKPPEVYSNGIAFSSLTSEAIFKNFNSGIISVVYYDQSEKVEGTGVIR